VANEMFFMATPLDADYPMGLIENKPDE